MPRKKPPTAPASKTETIILYQDHGDPVWRQWTIEEGTSVGMQLDRVREHPTTRRVVVFDVSIDAPRAPLYLAKLVD